MLRKTKKNVKKSAKSKKTKKIKKKVVKRSKKVSIITKAPEPNYSKLAIATTLDFLEKIWPNKAESSVKEAFLYLKASLNGVLPKSRNSKILKLAFEYVDPLSMVKSILTTKDMLFLSRQITYHVSASSNLPKIWCKQDVAYRIISDIIDHIVKRSNRSGKIKISIQPFKMRNGTGVEISFEALDIKGKKKTFVDELLSGDINPDTGISLYQCRKEISDTSGRMWAEMLRGKPSCHILFPSNESLVSDQTHENQTFKYDISIANYANVRKRFGIKKSASLILQIEHYIKALVRYPMDMVMAADDKGIITTIYETQNGAANSVASRISHRLGSEDFKIGKKGVDLQFKYQLSPLATIKTSETNLREKH